MKYISALLVAFLMLGCKNPVSNDHLPPKEMGNILIDLHLAEVYSDYAYKDTAKRIPVKNLDSLSVFYKDVFAHYHTTQQQFDNSLKWYKQHPEDLDSIYSNMVAELTNMA